MVNFDIAPVNSSIIMVVGVGGGGGNAVNHMFRLGITDVSFMICNTDRQALDRSPITNKIRLGENLTEGLGAGNKPERGRAAAIESIEEIKEKLLENNIRMVFITAGMGGGTGTGAAPVIAQAAKDLGILTVAIVTIPFKTEGRRRILQAIDGIEEIRHNVDSLLVVNNENIHEIYGELGLSEAFGKADDILATAAKSIAEIITSHHQINVDFADVQTVMRDSGIALMGSAVGGGENRAMEVAQLAMSSPLLNHRDISGAQNVLLNITSGTSEVKLSETYNIIQYIQERAGNDNATDLIWGAGIDESLGENIRITVIATGFDVDSIPAIRERYAEVVKDPKAVPPTLIQEVNHRETISLIDLEGDNGSQKKKPQPAASDDFSLNTYNQTGNSEYSAQESQYNNYQGYEQQQPVRLEAPLEEAAPVWNTIQNTNYNHQYQPSYNSDESSFQAYLSHTPTGYVEPIVPVETPPAVVAPTPTPEPEHVPEPVVTTAPVPEPQVQAVDNNNGYLTDDELDIPAYIRRGMKIEVEPTDSKISRETLKNDSAHDNRQDSAKLFI